MKMKRQLVLLVISTLVISLLPMRNATVSEAAKEIAREGYGLNNPTTNSDGITTWDCVWFGNYWQEDTNGDGKADKNDAKQAIKWRVLSVDSDDAFLLADKNLDVQRYNDTYANVTWEMCTMRSWLNGYGATANLEGKDYSSDNFFDYAFTSAEQSAVQATNVVNNDNSVHETDGGKNTLDQVYLLSLDEVMNPSYGFTTKTDETKTRRAVNTLYVAGGGETNLSSMCSVGETDVWWLRSPGNYNDFATFVAYDGYMNWYGNFVHNDSTAVRPALHLNLKVSSDAISTSSWSYAGTVTSEEGGTGSATPTPVPTVKPTMSPGTENSPLPTSPSVSSTPTASPTVTSVGKVVSIELKQKKQTVTASWKKVSGAAGYQLWYSTSKKWKGKKQKLLRKNKVTVKNLKKKKTYYFRVRAYRLEGAKKVYGAWSKTKRITMKK